jgi:lipopolysaccharide/colanic/teichoic acid biosynthesis glycosyltransferase
MLRLTIVAPPSPLRSQSLQGPAPRGLSLPKPWDGNLDLYLPFKRAMDCLIAALVLVAGAPIWLLVAAAVRLSSSGPAIYRQTRVGQGGRLFVMPKFRTMVEGAEERTGPVWAVAGDPRQTPLGKVLRRTRVDEIPQLWNVLRGEMSLVGPRPERPAFVSWLAEEIPGYEDRLAVRPGVTGLAQIHGPYGPTLEEVRRKLTLDRRYLERIGPLTDLSILLRTVPYILS